MIRFMRNLIKYTVGLPFIIITGLVSLIIIAIMWVQSGDIDESFKEGLLELFSPVE